MHLQCRNHVAPLCMVSLTSPSQLARRGSQPVLCSVEELLIFLFDVLALPEGIPASGLKRRAASLRSDENYFFLASYFTDDGNRDSMDLARQAAGEFLRHGE